MRYLVILLLISWWPATCSAEPFIEVGGGMTYFHQYKKDGRPGRKIGHVTLLGQDLVELTHEVQHAVDYMSGEIDE